MTLVSVKAERSIKNVAECVEKNFKYNGGVNWKAERLQLNGFYLNCGVKYCRSSGDAWTGCPGLVY